MLDADVRAAYRAVFNFHDKWQHLPTAPIEEWCKAAAECPPLCADLKATPLAYELLLVVWNELSRQRTEVGRMPTSESDCLQSPSVPATRLQAVGRANKEVMQHEQQAQGQPRGA